MTKSKPPVYFESLFNKHIGQTKVKNISGIITALATPFLQGKLDSVSFKKLLHFQIGQGVNGFVVNGTTAESPCLFPTEVEQLVKWTKEEAGERPLILGVGGNCTQKTLENIKMAERLMADAVLAVVPYYNKPPQRGLVKHFKTLAEESKLPVILYNVPSRTGVGLSLESIIELSRHPNIIGIKEASGDLDLGKEIVRQGDFILLSGDDDTCFDLCALGAQGVISVVSHVIAKEMKSVFQKIKQSSGSQIENSLMEYKKKYTGLLKNIYYESNPIGIKMALNLLGIFSTTEMRSPLVSLAEKESQLLKESLKEVNLL